MVEQEFISENLSCPKCHHKRLHIDQSFCIQLADYNEPETFRIKVSIDCQNEDCDFCKDVIKETTLLQHELRPHIDQLKEEKAGIVRKLETCAELVGYTKKEQEELIKREKEVDRKIRQIGQQERQQLLEQKKE